MRSLVFLFAIASAVAATSDEVVSRACGTLMPSVDVSVVDAETKAPIDAATVTFFDVRDHYRFMEIEAARRKGRTTPEPPSGIVVKTDANGRAALRCTFAFTKLTFRSGASRHEVYPEGRFRIVARGYPDTEVEARMLFPHAPYVTELPVGVVTLQRSPNQSLEPTH
jgi:hypothetical protein